MLTAGLTEIEVPVQQGGKSVINPRTHMVWFGNNGGAEMLCFGPLTHQDGHEPRLKCVIRACSMVKVLWQ